jgi:thrombospondin type 3 repeat protein
MFALPLFQRLPLCLALALALGLTLASCSEKPGGAGGGPRDAAGSGDGAAVTDDTGTPTSGADGANDTDGAPAGDGGPSSSDTGFSGDGGPNPNNPNNAMIDSDCDGLSDQEEFSIVYPNGQRTSPSNPDSDGDNIPDGIEAGKAGTVQGSGCPAIADADPATRTSPVNPDTDGDGLPDGLEDKNHNGKLDPGETDPNSRDTDGDQIADSVEDANHNGMVDAGETDPTKRDSDGDMISDGIEDANHDGMRTPGETDPLNGDTDGDMLSDGAEDSNHDGVKQPWETDPRTTDTDCDALSDFEEEMSFMTSPLVVDTDQDALNDGLEEKRTTPVAGSMCMLAETDTDPSIGTNPLNHDTDGDRLIDGNEDRNHNGHVDMGETDPNVPDTDGDMLTDGDEVAAGTDPTNPNDPNPQARGGITAICSDQALTVVNFNIDANADWTVASQTSFAYTAVTVSAAGTFAAALDDSQSGVSALVVSMPLISPNPATVTGQADAILNRFAANGAAEQLAISARQSPRTITSHDGFPAGVSAIADANVTAGTRDAAALRNSLLRVVTGLPASSLTGLPPANGAASTSWAISYEVLIRPSALIVIAAVLDRAQFNDPANPKSIEIADLTNGTAIARAGAERGKGCNTFTSAGPPSVDFIWMSDISGSTDDDRGRIVSAGGAVFNALATNNIDFRMGVVQHIENIYNRGSGNGGTLYGSGFVRDSASFTSAMQNNSNNDGCEFGLTAASNAISRALPRTPAGMPDDPRKIRQNALLAVFYVSDEHAQEIEGTQTGCGTSIAYTTPCDTGLLDVFNNDNNVCTVVPNAAQESCISTITAPFLQQIQSERGIAFSQTVDAAPPEACNVGHFQCMGDTGANEPGRGYLDIANATGGIHYSPCLSDPGSTTLQAIVDAVTGAASQYQLRGNPISMTLKVGITRAGMTTTTVVPRDKQNGFDYDPASNSIFFRGTTYRPAMGDLVTVSFRVWEPPMPPCGGMCTANQVCMPQVQVCGCDQAACAQRCGPNQICTGSSCACTCTADCNGRCGPDQVCNQASCQCECAPDCGGRCGPGTTCNPATCACDCSANCGGACPMNETCNTSSCQCQCAPDCGGACAQGSACNPSTCSCGCDTTLPGCSGNATRDPANGCNCTCPTDCGGCPDGTACDMTSCTCGCQVGCAAQLGCQNLQVCDQTTRCTSCTCPANCGDTCTPTEMCDANQCKCVPRL